MNTCIHHWVGTTPQSDSTGDQYADWYCKHCGSVRLNVPEPKMPAQYHLTPKYQAMQKREEL